MGDISHSSHNYILCTKEICWEVFKLRHKVVRKTNNSYLQGCKTLYLGKREYQRNTDWVLNCSRNLLLVLWVFYFLLNPGPSWYRLLASGLCILVAAASNDYILQAKRVTQSLLSISTLFIVICVAEFSGLLAWLSLASTDQSTLSKCELCKKKSKLITFINKSLEISKQVKYKWNSSDGSLL